MSFAGPSYCQVSDVITAMTSYNSAGTPGEISSTIVQLAIQQASAKVSAWTNNEWGTDSGGAAIPIPDMIQNITINIAAYFATLSYRKNKAIEANDPVLLRYNDACADLKAIQMGMITPNPVSPNEPLYNKGATRNVRPRIFSPSDSNTHVEGGRVQPNTWPIPGQVAPWLGDW